MSFQNINLPDNKVNKKCKNININRIIDSGVCRKLVFEDCNGYDFIKQNYENEMYKNILKKCDDIGIKNINNKHYCTKHCINYRYEKPEECAICSEIILYEEEIPLNCGHWFHLNCLKLCDKMQCPMCRTFYNINEIMMIYDLVSILVKPQNDDNTFYLNIPREIVQSNIFGLNYIELIYMEIITLYKSLNLEYTLNLVNKVLMNIFKNNDYLELSLKIYNMFDKIIQNNVITGYILKSNIDFYEDNEYTLNYDEFQEIIENLYHSV